MGRSWPGYLMKGDRGGRGAWAGRNAVLQLARTHETGAPDSKSARRAARPAVQGRAGRERCGRLGSRAASVLLPDDAVVSVISASSSAVPFQHARLGTPAAAERGEPVSPSGGRIVKAGGEVAQSIAVTRGVSCSARAGRGPRELVHHEILRPISLTRQAGVQGETFPIFCTHQR